MTLIVGFVGSDGAVMASDSQASEEDKTWHEVPKIWEESGLLFGYSGNTAVGDPITAALAQHLKDKDLHQNRWKIKALLCSITGPVMAGEYKNYVPKVEAGHVPGKLAGTLLVLGRDEDGYWLMDVNYNNVATFHDQRGFHAIGSGSAAAQMARGLLSHYEPAERRVKQLRLIAYRTVEACIGHLDLGVGGAIQLWSSTDGGDFTEASGEDLKEVAHGVSQWALIEQESLDKVIRQAEGEPEPKEESEVPEPFEEGEGAEAKPPAKGSGEERSEAKESRPLTEGNKRATDGTGSSRT
jgi:20S proteasome alpha/beta subunit